MSPEQELGANVGCILNTSMTAGALFFVGGLWSLAFGTWPTAAWRLKIAAFLILIPLAIFVVMVLVTNRLVRKTEDDQSRVPELNPAEYDEQVVDGFAAMREGRLENVPVLDPEAYDEKLVRGFEAIRNRKPDEIPVLDLDEYDPKIAAGFAAVKSNNHPPKAKRRGAETESGRKVAADHEVKLATAEKKLEAAAREQEPSVGVPKQATAGQASGREGDGDDAIMGMPGKLDNHLKLVRIMRRIGKPLSIADLSKLVVSLRPSDAEKAERELFDLVCNDPDNRAILERYGATRADIEGYYRRLRAMGQGRWIRESYVAAATIAVKPTLIHLLETVNAPLPDGWDEDSRWVRIVFDLVRYFESGNLPVR